MYILLALLALVFIPPVDKPDCRQIEALTGGVEVPWLGYENGGWDLPEDREITDRIDFADGGIWEMTSKSTPDRRWLFVFGDYDYSTDANGQHGGNHDFCLVEVHDA
jgi:hypothetical protein